LDLDVIEAMAASSGCVRLHLIWLTGGCCDLEYTSYNARPLLLAPCSEAHPSRMAFLSMGTFIEDLRRHFDDMRKHVLAGCGEFEAAWFNRRSRRRLIAAAQSGALLAGGANLHPRRGLRPAHVADCYFLPPSRRSTRKTCLA
jgi:hypothetical protein